MTEGARYTVEFDDSVAKALRKLPKDVTRRLVSAAYALAIEPRPHGCLKLEGSENEYRIRVGDYRIIYSIQDAMLLVLVIDLGHRKDIYR